MSKTIVWNPSVKRGVVTSQIHTPVFAKKKICSGGGGGSRIGGQGQIRLGMNNLKTLHFRVVNRGLERGDRVEGRFGQCC